LQVHQQSQSDAFDKLHHEKHFVFGGPAEFEGADDIGVIQRERNFAFGGFIEPLEALFKALRFFLVKHFKGNGATRLQIDSLPDFGHAALTDATDEVESAGNIGLSVCRFFGKELFEHADLPRSPRRFRD
jgi:hypothetical protein